jgi:hypothetical protein
LVGTLPGRNPFNFAVLPTWASRAAIARSISALGTRTVSRRSSPAEVSSETS